MATKIIPSQKNWLLWNMTLICQTYFGLNIMKLLIKLSVALWLLSGIPAFAQTPAQSFDEIYNLIEKKNFFKASEIYFENKSALNVTHQLLIEASLDNAFNKLHESNKKIDQLLKTNANLGESLALHLYFLKEDNSVKLFEYKDAKKALAVILSDYKKLLSKDEIKDTKNSLKIWTALENAPKQTVKILQSDSLKMEKDKVGLNNLRISGLRDTIDFIFDTGANLSTVPKSTAQKMGMKIISGNIQVGTITGEKVSAQMAVCPQFHLGNIEVQNAVFLVLDDKQLSFPEIGYQIHGILGFPVIEALQEIQLTQDGYFIVLKEETQINEQPNMAMDGLTPLIYIDGKHYSFDTGADNSMFYHTYYLENQTEIDQKYTPTKFSFGGAAGHKEFEGFLISKDLDILGKKAQLTEIQLLKEKIKENENVYGNIGQDVIKQFNKMTLNFNKMFIRFD